MVVKFTDNAPQALNESDAAVEAALLAIGAQAEGYAKNELSHTPKRIDTGLLRNSITYALGGQSAKIGSYHASKGSNRYTSGKNKGKRYSATSSKAGAVGFGSYAGQAPADTGSRKSVWVGTNVEYSTYVHNGTYKMTANPFLRNGVSKHGAIFRQIIEQYLRKG